MNLQVAKAVVPHAEVAEMDHVVKVAVDTKAVPAAVAIKEKAAAEVATKAAPEAVQDIAAVVLAVVIDQAQSRLQARVALAQEAAASR